MTDDEVTRLIERTGMPTLTPKSHSSLLDLLADLATRADVRYLHRPANLEDLFIKLTGRELRD